MNSGSRSKDILISVFVYAYKGLTLYFLILAILLFALDEGRWVNISLVFLMLLPLFIVLSLRRRFSR